MAFKTKKTLVAMGIDAEKLEALKKGGVLYFTPKGPGYVIQGSGVRCTTLAIQARERGGRWKYDVR